MGNAQNRGCIVNSLSELDDSHAINQGTSESRLPLLAFHQIHGSNIQLLQNGRVARRKESFCKGLAFSNRPVAVDENICMQLIEVAQNWSGVLRFGVSNEDPETFRNTPVPKFACPDLTSKEGYWAKALPERYSVEGNILHFYINQAGELHYGINGVPKGIFLTGINTTSPMWLIVDIYGNSVALKFIDSSEYLPTTHRRGERASSALPRVINSTTIEYQPDSSPVTRAAPAPPSVPGLETLRFHAVTGRHVSLNALRQVATRREQEYTQGYVFTERPIRNNEKVIIQVSNVIDLYNGGLAFGVTCCDPATLRATDFPEDSADLIDFPQYWVGIKDVALAPRQNTILSFWITDSGEVKFEINQSGSRTILHVDNTLQLYFYFDVYGSTQEIKLLGVCSVSRSPVPSHAASSSAQAHAGVGRPPSIHSVRERVALPPPGTSGNSSVAIFRPTVSSSAGNPTPSIPLSRSQPRPALSSSAAATLGANLRVNLRDTHSASPGVSGSGNSFFTENLESSRLRPAPPTSTSRRTIDELLGDLDSPPAIPPRTVQQPPPIAPRPMPSVSSAPTFAPPPPPARPAPTPPSFASVSASASPFASASLRPAPPQHSVSANALMTNSAGFGLKTGGEAGGSEEDNVDECIVCMSSKIETVIYTCGHMCMCFSCSQQTMNSRNPNCPICRQTIKDIIKIYKS